MHNVLPHFPEVQQKSGTEWAAVLSYGYYDRKGGEWRVTGGGLLKGPIPHKV